MNGVYLGGRLRRDREIEQGKDEGQPEPAAQLLRQCRHHDFSGDNPTTDRPLRCRSEGAGT